MELMGSAVTPITHAPDPNRQATIPAAAPHRPLECYSMVGDIRSAALISLDGDVDWMCLPRFDSASCFSAILGGPQYGHWSLKGAATPTRRWLGDTMIVETRWTSDQGVARVLDFMPIGTTHPALVRIIEGLGGQVDFTSELVVRPDYGRTTPWARRLNGTVRFMAGPDSYWLQDPVGHDVNNERATARFSVRTGDRIALALGWEPSHILAPPDLDPIGHFEYTQQFWSSWADQCEYDGPNQQAVLRSLLVLKALTFQPTGGIIAAPTCSLPEEMGGERNWDYRYCWLRDATMCLDAFMAAGYTEEAYAWREWLLRAVAGSPADVQVMYQVDGGRRIPEVILDHLPGYGGSTPVRIGNAAVDQYQQDIYGEVLDCLYLANSLGLPPTEDTGRLQAALSQFVADTWMLPDRGIWEVRGDRRHFVHSKIMAWVAADRAARSARQGWMPGDAARWERLAAQIKDEILRFGYHPQLKAFTQSYGSTNLDAAVLQIPYVGFLEPDDPRMLGTIDAVQAALASPSGLLYRYSTEVSDDGLSGSEGTFLACTLWLADALGRAGRYSQAQEVLDQVLELSNDMGLLAEQYDAQGQMQLGNFPQAFSHVPVVKVAVMLHRRQQQLAS